MYARKPNNASQICDEEEQNARKERNAQNEKWGNDVGKRNEGNDEEKEVANEKIREHYHRPPAQLPSTPLPVPNMGSVPKRERAEWGG